MENAANRQAAGMLSFAMASDRARDIQSDEMAGHGEAISVDVVAQTTMEGLAAANWEDVERDVVMRIRLLRDTAHKMGRLNHPAFHDTTDKVANELLLPNIELLAKFCTNIAVEPPDPEARPPDSPSNL